MIQLTESNIKLIIKFAMSIKTICDALNIGKMEEYLYNSILLMNIVDKLPLNHKLMRGKPPAE